MFKHWRKLTERKVPRKDKYVLRFGECDWKQMEIGEYELEDHIRNRDGIVVSPIGTREKHR